MLIPLKDADKHMCPQSAAREKPFGCRGRGCAAWVTLWLPGQRVGMGQAYRALIAKAEIGMCGLLPRFTGEDDREVAQQELHTRYGELIAAGLVEPAPAKTVIDPFFGKPTTAPAASPPITRNCIGEI